MPDRPRLGVVGALVVPVPGPAGQVERVDDADDEQARRPTASRSRPDRRAADGGRRRAAGPVRRTGPTGTRSRTALTPPSRRAPTSAERAGMCDPACAVFSHAKSPVTYLPMARSDRDREQQLVEGQRQDQPDVVAQPDPEVHLLAPLAEDEHLEAEHRDRRHQRQERDQHDHRRHARRPGRSGSASGRTTPGEGHGVLLHERPPGVEPLRSGWAASSTRPSPAPA